MNKTITMIKDEFENEKTNEKVEGITIIVDGILKGFLDIIISKDNEYETYMDVIQASLLTGLNIIKDK